MKWYIILTWTGGNEYDSTIEGNNMTIGMEVDIDCSPTSNEVDEGDKKVHM